MRYFTKAAEKHARQQQRAARKQAEIVRIPKADRPPRHTIPTDCPICQQPTDAADMCADHCHTTGRSRDWVCRKCNAGLGMFKDNPEVLERAAAYLRKHAPDMTPEQAMLAAYRAHHPRATQTTPTGVRTI